MKKITSLSMAVICLILVGCGNKNHTKSTRFLLDTVVTLEADCDAKTLNGAFGLCEKYEKLLSKTVKTSDVAKLNRANNFIKVSNDTKKIISRSLYYSGVSGGAFDITICPVSDLWDFEGTSLPDRNEIAEALKNVDYESVEINGNRVFLHGAKIDLGGIAKGYIADRLTDYFKENNVKSGIINLGGNVTVFGDEEKAVGIQKPFCDNEISAKIKVKNKSVVTSGTYQRYIKKDGKIYHHILDVKTGYAAETDLDSATVIGESSFDLDALSTICILKGSKEAKKLIEEIKNTEAVFIHKNGNITYTSGLKYKNNTFYL